MNKNMMNMLTEWKKPLSSENNWTNYRDKIEHTQPPCVPFLGMHLTDLVMVIRSLTVVMLQIDDGLPNTIHNLVNFAKRRRLAGIIKGMEQYQHTSYNFEVVPKIRNFFNGEKELPNMNEEDGYKLSLQIEPKAADKKRETVRHSNAV